jgi:hypothetical protein
MNDELLKRKHFLLRALAYKNVENVNAAKIEIAELEEQIRKNTRQILIDNEKKLVEDLSTIKVEVREDGCMKREIANLIIDILEPHLEKSTLKGVFRQGYKIMRAK